MTLDWRKYYFLGRALLIGSCVLLLGCTSEPSSKPNEDEGRPTEGAIEGIIRGTVKSKSNSAWSGARVTLVSVPIPELPFVGTPHRVEVTTGSDGSFEAKALLGREYSVWASEPKPNDSALQRFTNILEDVRVDVEGVALLEDAPACPQLIQLPATSDWRGDQPFRIRVRIGARNPLVLPVSVDDQSSITAPALPGEKFELFLHSRSGVLIHAGTHEVARTLHRTKSLPLPPRKSKNIIVRDVRNGNPIANAKILFNANGEITTIGATRSNGVASVPYPGSVFTSFPFLVVAPGYAFGKVTDGDAESARSGVWNTPLATIVHGHANLRPSVSIRGRFVVRDDIPAKDMIVLIRHDLISFDSEHSSHAHGSIVRIIRTDGAGRFLIQGLLPEAFYKKSISALLSSRHVERMPTAWKKEPKYLIPDVLSISAPIQERGKDLGILNLSRM